MHIVITRDGGRGKAVSASLLENEAKLQKYLEDNLASLPWSELEPDLDLFPIGREFRTHSRRGDRTDLLAIDAAGNFYIVETKLERNADKRTVIAQALDYGASIWSSFPNPVDLTAELDKKYSFQTNAKSHFEIDEEELRGLLERFETNVREARFRFIVVMDAVDEGLKDLIRFINPNSNFKVYVVDLKFFSDQDIEVVVPTMYGVEAAKLASTSSRSPRKDELTLEEFVSRIPATLSIEDRAIIERLARVTVSDTAHRPTHSSFYGETKGTDRVRLYRIAPHGEIRVDLPGPKSGSHMHVHERWKAALLDAGILPSEASEGGTGYPLKLNDWKPHAEKLINAISTIAASS